MTSEASHPTTQASVSLYANLPSSVVIRTVQKSGRGLWCRKSIRKGSVIFAQRPHVAVLSTPNLHLHCSYCSCAAGNGVQMMRCTKCRTIWYCSSTCQNTDWKIHKHECLAIKNWMSSVPDGSPPGEAVRSLGRILWGRQVEGEDSIWWKEIRALQSHRTSIPPHAVESHAKLAHALVRYLRVNSPSELKNLGISSTGDLVDLVSQFATNTFTLASPTLSPIGTCVSPIAALFNHSCLPNAVIVFPQQSHETAYSSQAGVRESSLHVIAIKDIYPEEEILTAYCDTSLPTFLRQKSLKETYNFECTCLLCVPVEKAVDPRDAIWCPVKCGGICPFPNEGTFSPRCNTCRAEFPATALGDIEDKHRIGQEAFEKADSLQLSDQVRALNITSHVLPLLSSQFPPSAHPMLGLLRLHQTLYISSLTATPDRTKLDDAIRSSARVVSGLMDVFIEGHPVRAIALSELGKLLAVDEFPDPIHSESTAAQSDVFPPSGAARLALAIDTLKRALRELMIGFGEKTGGGDVGRDIRESLIRLEEEMNIYGRGVRNTLQNMSGRAP